MEAAVPAGDDSARQLKARIKVLQAWHSKGRALLRHRPKHVGICRSGGFPAAEERSVDRSRATGKSPFPSTAPLA